LVSSTPESRHGRPKRGTSATGQSRTYAAQ